MPGKASHPLRLASLGTSPTIAGEESHRATRFLSSPACGEVARAARRRGELRNDEGPAPWSETGPSIVVCGYWTAHALFRREPPKKPRSSPAIGDNETLDHLLSNLCCAPRI